MGKNKHMLYIVAIPQRPSSVYRGLDQCNGIWYEAGRVVIMGRKSQLDREAFRFTFPRNWQVAATEAGVAEPDEE